jgi:hypothetical protein
MEEINGVTVEQTTEDSEPFVVRLGESYRVGENCGDAAFRAAAAFDDGTPEEKAQAMMFVAGAAVLLCGMFYGYFRNQEMRKANIQE